MQPSSSETAGETEFSLILVTSGGRRKDGLLLSSGPDGATDCRGLVVVSQLEPDSTTDWFLLVLASVDSRKAGLERGVEGLFLLVF